MFRKNILMIVMMFALMIVIAACDSSDKNNNNNSDNTPGQEETATGDNKPASITVTDSEGNEVTFDKVPERIITLSAGDLDIVDALGGEIVGRPTIRGEVPEHLSAIEEVGTTNDINMEKVASLNPDLIIAHPQLNAKNLPAFKELGIDVLLTGANSIDEVETTIEMIGKVLQKEEEAKQLKEQIDAKIAEFKNSEESNLRALIVFGVPSNWMVALPNSLSGSMLETTGSYNIAKDYPKLDKFPQYAQLDIEKIVEANPEIIFLISPGPSQGIKESFTNEIAKNQAWSSIDAVKNNNISLLPNDLFGSNPGTKIIDSLDYLKNELQAIEK